jgi:hypothetical protein
LSESLLDPLAPDGIRAPSIWPAFVLMAAIWILVALYTNERVLTPQILADLALRGGGMAMAPDQVDALQRLERMSYGLIPVLLAVRVAITALVLQLFTILLSAEVAYRELFRATLWGFGAVMYGMFVQTLRLDLIGPGLTVAELTVVPDSLAALILTPAPAATIGYSALSLLSIHSLLWIGVIFGHLRFATRLTRRPALLVPLAGWTTISLAQLGLQAFAAQMLP